MQSTIHVKDTDERRQKDDVRLLDVRTPAEYEGKHVEDSSLIPLDRLSDHADRLNDLSKPLVLVCRTGNRAEQARELLAAEGVVDTAVMKGGIKAWEAEGLGLVEGTRRWELERLVRMAAGLLVLAGAVLGLLVHPAFYGLSASVGAGLTFSGVTNTCAMAFLQHCGHEVRCVDERLDEYLASGGALTGTDASPALAQGDR